MSRSEVGLNETPVVLMASSPAATAGGTPLVRPIARFASPHASSGSSDPRVPLKKRAIRECFDGDDNEIPEPPRLRRQKVIRWRPSGFQSWGEGADDQVISPVNLFASKAAADFQLGLDSKPTTITQRGYNNKNTKSRGGAIPLFGVWSREPLFVDDDTDTEMELESFANPHTSHGEGRIGWTELQSFAITPSPHPMDLAQSPLPFQVPSEHCDAPTSHVSLPPLQYYHDTDADTDADTDMGGLDQEGSDWFISSKTNELTRLPKYEEEHEHEDQYEPCDFVHEYDYAEGMNMHYRQDSSPLLAKLPGFIKSGGTIEDMMKERILPTPDPTPPRESGVHHLHYEHHRGSTGSNNDYYDPATSMMQHPGAYATTNAWFETNSSFSPARIDYENNNDGNDSISGNHDSASACVQPLFFAGSAGRSSAFAPNQVRDWHGDDC
jgi:hypothetical protein